jgi:hypothetical protein
MYGVECISAGGNFTYAEIFRHKVNARKHMKVIVDGQTELMGYTLESEQADDIWLRHKDGGRLNFRICEFKVMD